MFYGNEKWVTDDVCERMGSTKKKLITNNFNINSCSICQCKKPNTENLTITAEQTHLCVFTFPAPKPVLAPPFHCQSSVFYFEREKKGNTNAGSPPNTHTHMYIQLMTVFHPLCVVQPVRITYPRQHVWDRTSSNQRPESPCCVRAGGQNAKETAEGEKARCVKIWK